MAFCGNTGISGNQPGAADCRSVCGSTYRTSHLKPGIDTQSGLRVCQYQLHLVYDGLVCPRFSFALLLRGIARVLYYPDWTDDDAIVADAGRCCPFERFAGRSFWLALALSNRAGRSMFPVI